MGKERGRRATTLHHADAGVKSFGLKAGAGISGSRSLIEGCEKVMNARGVSHLLTL